MKQSAAMRPDPGYRYEELASFITGLVDGGTLSPGARAPSLRQISRQRRISLSTALQAYRLLEDRGVLEARPQSGFYIARRGIPHEGVGRPTPVCPNTLRAFSRRVATKRSRIRVHLDDGPGVVRSPGVDAREHGLPSLTTFLRPTTDRQLIVLRRIGAIAIEAIRGIFGTQEAV